MLTTRTRLKVLSEIARANDSVGSVQENVDEPDGQELERRERRRKNIIEELFDTEKTYLRHLDVTHRFFEFPLRFNCLVSERAHSHLFSNLEQILEVNTKLLEYMEQTTVGTAFKFLGPFLKLYSMYANNHQQASSTLQENVQKNEKFAAFIREQEDRPEVMGLKLGALLITPVQRIPRYKLLLEDLLENTSPEHHDYLHLKEAAKQVGEIALHINEHVRQHENFQRMLTIQNSFDSSAPKILAPGREFLKEGKLNKVSRRGGKHLERMFFLFSDMLIYGKPKLLDSGSSSYSCCCVLPLRHCAVQKVLGSVVTSDGGGMFRVNCKDESLLLYSTDPDDAGVWVDLIEAAIRKLNLNRQTLRKPSSNKVPVRGKSLIKMRLRERKQDLKRKVTGSRKKRGASKDKGKESSPLKSSLRDVSNCLTPPKRQRTGSIDSSNCETASCSYNYEERNEINLDNWSPSVLQNDDDDGDDFDAGPIMEEDESDDENRIPAVVIENPPYPESLSDLDTKKCDLDFDGELDGVSYGNGRHGGPGTNNRGSATYSQGSASSSGSGPGRYGECDYSSQPWINPKFQTGDAESDGACSTWPIRRVMQATSSLGDMMDSVRSKKRCSVM